MQLFCSRQGKFKKILTMFNILSLNVANIKFHRSILKPQAANEIMLSFDVWPTAKFSNKTEHTNNFTNSQRECYIFLKKTTPDYLLC